MFNKYGNRLGSNFRNIRKSKNVSLEQAARDITTTTRLSNWELGNIGGGMPIEIVNQLLKRLNISYDELVQGKARGVDFSQTVSNLYQENDINGLRQVIQKYVTKYKVSGKIEDLIYGAIADNFYMDLTGKNDLSMEEIQKIESYLSEIKFWSNEDIKLFANTQMLLSSNVVYKLSRSLISATYDDKTLNKNTAIAILNAIFVLIKDKKLSYATEILKIADTLNFSKYDYLAVQRLEFMHSLIDYLNTGNDQSVILLFNKMKELPKYDQLLQDFKFAFKQIKEIYSSKK